MSQSISLSQSFFDRDVSLTFKEESIFHDRVIVVEGKKFYVVAGNLSLYSEYFRELFQVNSDAEIELNDLYADDFDNFLQSLLPNGFSVNATNLRSLMKLSTEFMAPIIWKKCMEFLHDETTFNSFSITSLLSWSRNSKSDDFKARMVKRLIEMFDKHNVHTSRCLSIASTYQLVELKEHIKIEFSKGIDGNDRAILRRICRCDVNSIEQLGLTSKVFNFAMKCIQSSPEGKIEFLEKIPAHRRDKYITGLDELLAFGFQGLKLQSSALGGIRATVNYNLHAFKNLIDEYYCRTFAKTRSLKHVHLAIAYDMTKYKVAISTYIKTTLLKNLSPANKRLLSAATPAVHKFVMDALLEIA